MNPLLEYLQQMAQLPEPYCPLERFIMAHGADHIAQRKPKAFRRGKPKYCFRNAAHLALEHDELRYVEGFGLRTDLFPILHAWCIDPDDRVIDITWTDPETCYYRGVVIARGILTRELVRLRHYGLLDGMKPNFDLMQRLAAKNNSEK